MLTVKYFSTTWCGPCKMFSPVFEAVMAETETNYIKIDAEADKYSALKYNITSVPTLVFEADGTVVHRHNGVMSKPQLAATISKFKQADPSFLPIFII